MIKVEGLNKKYKDYLAVNNISFNINKGDILGLLGPNGAGKSTTINMLSGVIKKTSGSIEIMGKNMDKQAEDIKLHMGVVPQDIVIFEDLKAKENLYYFGSLFGLKGQELKKRVDETLEFIGLVKTANRYPKTFSGGMKRRLNIGCAIVHEPSLIILDEPTVGIDAQSRNHIMETIKKLHARGATIVYTSHYMEEIETLCNEIIVIDKGKVIERGSKEELLKKYSNEDVLNITLTKEVPEILMEVIRKLNEVNSCRSKENLLEIVLKVNNGTMKNIFNVLEKYKVDFVSVNMRKNNLEDIFLLLTGKKLRD